MFFIRDVAPKDLDDLQQAAAHLDSVNLPDDRTALARIIDRSQRSFASALTGGTGELAVADRCFVFVAADVGTGRVVGTSMIFAQHGSRRAPHVFFDVLEEERYSETLDRHFAHRVLRIGYNYKGLTEIGGLVVRPEFRAPPREAGAVARLRALPLHRPAPRSVSRRGALRADAAAGARRHQPAVGVAGAAASPASATRRPIACRSRTRSSSAPCSPRTPSTRRCCRRTCRS